MTAVKPLPPGADDSAGLSRDESGLRHQLVNLLGGSQYALEPSMLAGMLLRLDPVRSLVASLRFGAPVLIGRGSRVRVHRSARLDLRPGAMLLVGLAHDTPAGAQVRLRPRGCLRIEGRVQVMRGADLLVAHNARMSLAADTFINDGARLVCADQLDIGEGCAISWGARVLDTDVHGLTVEGIPQPRHAPVRIGARCWLGAGATVLKGVVLEPGSVVAAGAVVTARQGPHGGLLAGGPARTIRDDVAWTP